jgi:uncharacterized protein (DUF697 family)
MSAIMRPPRENGPIVESAKQRVIAVHVALVGLAAFIPVPFVDDYVKKRVERRMVKKLALAQGIDLSDSDVATLADAHKATWSGRFVGLALLPAKAIFKRVFLVLGIKSIVDSVSVTWHRAFLFDYALTTDRIGVDGAPSSAKLRAAIDAVCREVPVKPVEPILRAAFEGSKVAYAKIAAMFAKGLGKADSDHAVDGALDDAEKHHEAPGLIERLVRGFSEVPEAHRDRLRAALDRNLPNDG